MSLKASPVTLIPNSAKQGLTVMEHQRVTGGLGDSFISSVGKRCTQLYPNRGDGRESGRRKAPEHQGWEGKVHKGSPHPPGNSGPGGEPRHSGMKSPGSHWDFGADGATRSVAMFAVVS